MSRFFDDGQSIADQVLVHADAADGLLELHDFFRAHHRLDVQQRV